MRRRRADSSATRPKRRSYGLASDRTRAIPVVITALALAGLLAAGALVVSPRSVRHVPPADPSLLPAVALSSHSAAVWNCPGPLELGKGTAASVDIADLATRPVTAWVLVAETALAYHAQDGHELAERGFEVHLSAGSDQVVSLPADSVPRSMSSKRHPAALIAAARVTVTNGVVAVTESYRTRSSALQSACALGSAPDGYSASGETDGSSGVLTTVFNPDDTPAIVNVSIGTGGGAVAPAPLQGLVVPATSVIVLRVGHYVPQRVSAAIAVHASTGRVDVGSLAQVSTEYRIARLGTEHTYAESGSMLSVGVGRPLARWVMPFGGAGLDESEGIRIFDPTDHSARVTVTTEWHGARPSTLSLSVAAGHASDVTLADVPATAPTGSVASSAVGAGTVVVSSKGAGVVVERQTYQVVGTSKLVLSTLEPVATPVDTYVMPGFVSAGRGESLTITNAGHVATSVSVEVLGGASTRAVPGARTLIATVKLAAQASGTVAISSKVSQDEREATLVVTASQPLLVDGTIPSQSTASTCLEAAIPGE